jgi:prolyl oligopeptidase
MTSISYPKVRRAEENGYKLHGHFIEDAYVQLEDPNGAETIEFVKAQNELTRSILSKSSLKGTFKSTLTKLMDYPKAGCPQKQGSQYYYFYNSGLQPQSVLMRINSLDDKDAKVFFDPNKLAEDGTTSLSTYAFSESGKYFAYALSESGSDWVKVHVKNTLGDGESLPDVLKWVKFTSLAWTHDDKGFFYKQYPKPASLSEEKAGTETDKNDGCSLFYHKLGTTQDQDALVYTDPDSTSHPSITVSDDGKYIVLTVSLSCDPNSKVYICPMSSFLENYPKAPEFKCIVDNYDNAYSFLTNDDNIFWFETTLNAPKKRIVKFDLNSPEKGFEEVVGETKDVIDFITVSHDNKLIVCRLQEVKHVVTVYDLHSGKELYTLPLPIGSIINSLSGKRKESLMFYKGE